MPLITLSYIGFATGLLAGYTRLWYVILMGATFLAIYAVTKNSFTHTATFVLFIAGAALASTLPTPRPLRATPAGADTTSFLGQQRARANIAIDTVFRDDAPLAKALLIADQTEIPKEIKDRYANAGIVHMLSISGLHVAIIAMAVELFANLLRIPTKLATMTTVIVIMIYVAVIGFPPPAVRSGVMLAAMAASRALQRPTSRWATLALGAWLPLINPATILDLGYQLSVGGIAGLIASGALARRWLADKLSGWRYTLARSLLASSVATVVSGPLVAYAFGRISIIAPLTNLIADPIVSLAQPLLFLALIIAPLRPVAWFIADAVHPVLATFDFVARVGAAVPYATITIVPSLTAALLAGVAAIAIVVACVSRFPARPALAAVLAMCILPWVA